MIKIIFIIIGIIVINDLVLIYNFTKEYDKLLSEFHKILTITEKRHSRKEEYFIKASNEMQKQLAEYLTNKEV